MSDKKIIKFPQESMPFDDFLKDLKEEYDTGRITNFVCIYDAKYKPKEEKEGFVGNIEHYWFGDSSTNALGLCTIMQRTILDWVRHANECLDEGE